MLKKDHLQLGIVLGFVAPVFGVIIYYFLKFYTSGVGFVEYLRILNHYKPLLTVVSSLSLLANAALFTYYINGRKDKTAKGIFIATLIYGIGVLLVKLLR